MADDACPYCRMDRVEWKDAIPCAWKSLRGIYDDLCVKNDRDLISVLMRDDRILYVLALLVFFMIGRLLVLG